MLPFLSAVLPSLPPCRSYNPAYNLVHHALLLLAGNLRLQQIVNPVDPLEILADVHWTHIREKEEEEKMAPTSKSSTSRGNLPPAPQHQFVGHRCSCLTLLCLHLQEKCTSPGAAVVERNCFQITPKLRLVKHVTFQVRVYSKRLLSQLCGGLTSSDPFVCLL